MNTHTRCKSKSKTVTQITQNEYIIEGEVDSVRFACEVDPIINYVDIDGGPFLHVGRDFFGKGYITEIQYIDSNRDNYLIIKVTINEKTNQR